MQFEANWQSISILTRNKNVWKDIDALHFGVKKKSLFELTQFHVENLIEEIMNWVKEKWIKWLQICDVKCNLVSHNCRIGKISICTRSKMKTGNKIEKQTFEMVEI